MCMCVGGYLSMCAAVYKCMCVCLSQFSGQVVGCVPLAGPVLRN